VKVQGLFLAKFQQVGDDARGSFSGSGLFKMGADPEPGHQCTAILHS
jgi:hypothetical protein